MKLCLAAGSVLLIACAAFPARAETEKNAVSPDVVVPAWASRKGPFLLPPEDNPLPRDTKDSNAVSSPAEVHVPQHKIADPWDVSQKCGSGKLDGKACKFHWRPALIEQMQYLLIETGWNLGTDEEVWDATTHGHWFQNWVNADEGFKFSRWSDANPFIDDYVGHPMMGAITMDIFIQNDPRGKSVEFGKSKLYWHTRLWALVWSTVYSWEWKLGPISEASFGNTGGHVYYDHDADKLTNGTGTVGLVVTPVGGWVWSVAEDLMDQHVISKLDYRTGNSFYLFSMSFLNPCRSFANLMRYRAPWYRDSRPVPSTRDPNYATLTDQEVGP